MTSIRVYSSKRKNPKTGQWEHSIYYRTLENIEKIGAEVINNWYGVLPEMLDEDGKILASEVHASMTAKPYTVIKPTLDTLKATGAVLPASKLSKQAEDRARTEAEFARAAEERIRENRDRAQGQPVEVITRVRD